MRSHIILILWVINYISGIGAHYFPPEEDDSVLAGCVEIQQAEYRSIDGKYNQQGLYPILGAAGTPFVRLLSSEYDDDIGVPQAADPSTLYNGHPLPLAREVTLAFNVDGFTETNTHTPWITQWGQIVTHDIVHRATFKCEDLDCSACNEVNNFCFPIIFPSDDPYFSEECLEVFRDAPVCGTGTEAKTPREQMNVQTSFLDGSAVYGESGEELAKLRNLTNELGLLKASQETGSTGKPYLPQQSEDEELATLQVNFCDPGQRCFVSGDVRTMENWGLLATHTLLFREHNRLATELHELNPHWSGNKLFMEARKILGAEIQHITYAEFLPVLIGDEVQYGIGSYSGYDEHVDPGAISSFVSGAFRIHQFVKPVVDRLDENFQEIPEGSLPFDQTVANPNQLLEEGGIDPVIRGMGAPNKDTSDLTHTIFTNDTFLDLPTIDIHRGREYGIPPYLVWREYCGVTSSSSGHGRTRRGRGGGHGSSSSPTFDDLDEEITDPGVRQKLEDLYGTPENIDLWVGGVLEDPANGGLVGPVFGCLIAEQFRTLRDGDSFYYENPGVFSDDQLTEIRKQTLARVICDNGDAIERVQQNVFIPVKDDSEYLDCSAIPEMDLTKWQEQDTCEQD